MVVICEQSRYNAPRRATMNCPVCQHANPKRSAFCHYCGNRLKMRCPQCGRLVRVDFRFCNRCGYEIGPASTAPQPERKRPRSAQPEVPRPQPAAPDTNLQRLIPKELLSKLDAARASGEMVGERRVVSMLFCDVKGSTAAAEQLDPEDWAEIMNGAFECMIE